MVIPNSLVDLLHKFPDFSESCSLWSPSRNTDWMFETQNAFFPVLYSICCWNKVSENNFFSGWKDLLRLRKTIVEVVCGWSPSLQIRRGRLLSSVATQRLEEFRNIKTHSSVIMEMFYFWRWLRFGKLCAYARIMVLTW